VPSHRRIRARPYAPRTDGTAERLIQTVKPEGPVPMGGPCQGAAREALAPDDVPSIGTGLTVGSETGHPSAVFTTCVATAVSPQIQM